MELHRHCLALRSRSTRQPQVFRPKFATAIFVRRTWSCLIDANPLSVPLVPQGQPDQARVDADVERLIARSISGGDRRGHHRLAKQAAPETRGIQRSTKSTTPIVIYFECVRACLTNSSAYRRTRAAWLQELAPHRTLAPLHHLHGPSLICICIVVYPGSQQGQGMGHLNGELKPFRFRLIYRHRPLCCSCPLRSRKSHPGSHSSPPCPSPLGCSSCVIFRRQGSAIPVSTPVDLYDRRNTAVEWNRLLVLSPYNFYLQLMKKNYSSSLLFSAFKWMLCSARVKI